MEEADFAVSLANKIYSLNKNLIATVHTNPFSRSSFYRMMMRILYSNFNTIVSCSEGVGKILQDNIGLNNIKVIYNPIDLEEAKIKSSKPIAKKYQQYFKTNPVYINIGRLTEAKGQFHLIRSYSKVLKENPDAKLIILGEGELRAQLEKLIKRLNLKDKVLLLGNQDNVFPFLKQADCFVSSSLWEGLQITLIEALAVGTPVISTDCPTGPREIIAPNLSLGGKIDYPHYSKNGTLTRPFGIGGVSTSKMSLTSEESMLAEEMLSAVQRNKKSKEFYSLKRFMLKKIVDKWIRLINIKT
jgi:glycosyltransferase involved in cell wall biosynthesis